MVRTPKERRKQGEEEAGRGGSRERRWRVRGGGEFKEKGPMSKDLEELRDPAMRPFEEKRFPSTNEKQ